MAQDVQVSIERGKHGTVVPSGMGRLIEEELLLRGLRGRFVAYLGPKIRGSAHSPRFRATRLTASTVEAIAKPGDNGTAHVVRLRSDEAKPTPRELFERLRPEETRQNGARRFTDDEVAVGTLLRMLEEAGGAWNIETARAHCSATFGQANAKSWAQVFSTLERRGLVAIRRDGARLVGIALPASVDKLYAAETARADAPYIPPPEDEEAREAAPVPPSANEDPPPQAEPQDGLAGQLAALVARLGDREEKLLAATLEHEELLKEAETRANEWNVKAMNLREQIRKDNDELTRIGERRDAIRAAQKAVAEEETTT